MEIILSSSTFKFIIETSEENKSFYTLFKSALSCILYTAEEMKYKFLRAKKWNINLNKCFISLNEDRTQIEVATFTVTRLCPCTTTSHKSQIYLISRKKVVGSKRFVWWCDDKMIWCYFKSEIIVKNVIKLCISFNNIIKVNIFLKVNVWAPTEGKRMPK